MLATLFMVIFLALIAAFVFVDSSVFHMNTVQRAHNNAQAKNMAESVIAKALEKVMADQTYGTSSSTSYNNVPYIVTSNDGAPAVGLIAFNPSKASSVVNPVTHGKENIPWSMNNLGSDASREGCARTVPRYALHLVGTGISNGVVRHIEVIVHIPPFPYAIAASGKFEAGSGLFLTSVKKVEDAINGAPAIAPENLVPSHLASNSRDGKAIKLGKNTKITGDVRSSGGIETDPDGGTQIEGTMIRNADPINLPRIDVKSYDPDVQKMEGSQQLPAALDAQKLEGASKRQGNLTVNGDLTLDGALVYVDGDLTIHGSVKGKGGLFVTGKTTIDRGARLDTANTAVLISKGDVTLGGTGKNSSAFQGLIYTEGNFTARNITLLGSYVSNAGSGTTTTSIGNMLMENADIVGVPQYTKISFDVKLPPKVIAAKTEPTVPNFAACKVNAYDNSALNNNGDCVSFWGCNLDIRNVYDKDTDSFNADLVTPGNCIQASFEVWNGASGSHMYMTYDQMMRNYPSRWNFARPYVPGAVNSVVNQVKAAVRNYNNLYREYKLYLQQVETGSIVTSTATTTTVSVDLNQFLKLHDEMRVILWKEWEPK
jgi:hypothetical protein